MKAIESPIAGHKIVSTSEWLEARKAVLAKEKEFTRQRDELSRLRRELPWVKIEKDYVFETAQGKQTLADLFAGRSQLIIYHFMLGPGWEAGCPSCSYMADHFDGARPHLKARDVTLAVVSRAPLGEIERFKKRMGWNFNWASSYGSDFNFDYHVSFSKDAASPKDKKANPLVYYNYQMMEFPSEEAPGLSVFYKDGDGNIFHAYSTYARGLDILVGAYNFLDLAPKGRDEDGLAFTMSWVRHHDRYDDNYRVDPAATYQQPKTEAGGLKLKVEIRKIDPIRVAFVRHIGPYPECGAAWDKLMRVMGARGALGADSIRIGIGHDNPSVTPAAELRYDACVTVRDDFQPDADVGVQMIPGGEYAVATYVGPYEKLAEVYREFLGKKVPESGRELGSGYCFEIYVSDAAKSAPEDLVTEIYAPVRGEEPVQGCCSEKH